MTEAATKKCPKIFKCSLKVCKILVADLGHSTKKTSFMGIFQRFYVYFFKILRTFLKLQINFFGAILSS